MPLYVCEGQDVYISESEHVSYIVKPLYLCVCLIMSYLSAPEPTLWSALPVRDKSTARHTDPCPPHNPSLALHSPSKASLVSCLLAPPLPPPITSFLSLNQVLQTLLFPGLISLLFSLPFSLPLFFPPFWLFHSENKRFWLVSAFSFFGELWDIKMHGNAGTEKRGMAERSAKTVRTILYCYSLFL